MYVYACAKFQVISLNNLKDTLDFYSHRMYLTHCHSHCHCYHQYTADSAFFPFFYYQIGFTSSLPYVFCLIISPLWGYTVDVLRSKKYITTIFARRLSSFIGIYMYMRRNAYSICSIICSKLLKWSLSNENGDGVR